MTDAADAYFAFQNAGYDITIASPDGTAVTCSTDSIDLKLEAVRDLLDGPGYEQIKKPQSVKKASPKDFDAVVYFTGASEVEVVSQFVEAVIRAGGTAQQLEDGQAASSVIEVCTENCVDFFCGMYAQPFVFHAWSRFARETKSKFHEVVLCKPFCIFVSCLSGC